MSLSNSDENRLNIRSQSSAEFKHSSKQWCFASSTSCWICAVDIILARSRCDITEAIRSGACSECSEVDDDDDVDDDEVYGDDEVDDDEVDDDEVMMR